MLEEKILKRDLSHAISFKQAVETLEKELIIKAMMHNNWVIAKAARQLNITERVLSYKIRKYQIQRTSVDH